MIADSERREVAARLRDVEMHAIPDARIADNPMTVEFIAAAVFYDLPYVRGLFSRLADLIEPSEPKVKCVAEVKVDGERLEELVHDAAVELTGIDRDALLALADEIDRKSNDGTVNPDPMRPLATSLDLFGYARRIREALGVDE